MLFLVFGSSFSSPCFSFQSHFSCFFVEISLRGETLVTASWDATVKVCYFFFVSPLLITIVFFS
jgi:hypothetical protein